MRKIYKRKISDRELLLHTVEMKQQREWRRLEDFFFVFK